MRSGCGLQAPRETHAEHDGGGEEARHRDRREHGPEAPRVVAEVAGCGHADRLREHQEGAHAARDRPVMEAAEGRPVEAREQRRIAAHRIAVEDDIAGKQRHAARRPEEEDAGALQTEAHGGDAPLVEAVEQRAEAELPTTPIAAVAPRTSEATDSGSPRSTRSGIW